MGFADRLMAVWSWNSPRDLLLARLSSYFLLSFRIIFYLLIYFWSLSLLISRFFMLDE
jgi:hypothetical protein